MEDYEICLCDHLNKNHEYPIEELLGAISCQYANLAEKTERPAPETGLFYSGFEQKRT